jgi:hypothetical protein
MKLMGFKGLALEQRLLKLMGFKGLALDRFRLRHSSLLLPHKFSS